MDENSTSKNSQSLPKGKLNAKKPEWRSSNYLWIGVFNIIAAVGYLVLVIFGIKVLVEIGSSASSGGLIMGIIGVAVNGLVGAFLLIGGMRFLKNQIEGKKWTRMAAIAVLLFILLDLIWTIASGIQLDGPILGGILGGWLLRAIYPLIAWAILSRHAVRIMQYTILAFATIFALYPVWFAILASFRPGERLYTFNLLGMFIPTDITFENYRVILYEKPFITWLVNSIFVASVTTLMSLIITTSAAFALSRFTFRGRKSFLVFLLALSTFPGVLSLTAIALLLSAFGFYGNHIGLVMAYTTGTLVFCTWNLKGYFDTIPIDLEEAARIDGCGPIQAFLLVALPLVRPAMAVTALLAFLGSWGDFIFASVLVPAPDVKKLAVPALYAMANTVNIPWGQFAAGAVIVIIPTLIVFLLVQKNFESGLTMGGVKG
jgi:arabinogalactan oligomer/maltooligosaccharide transport system permease protein